MMLPRGTLYGFTAVGEEALVMLRIGAHVDAGTSPWGRTDGEGKPYVGSVRKDNPVETVFKPGSFFR